MPTSLERPRIHTKGQQEWEERKQPALTKTISTVEQFMHAPNTHKTWVGNGGYQKFSTNLHTTNRNNAQAMASPLQRELDRRRSAAMRQAEYDQVATHYYP